MISECDQDDAALFTHHVTDTTSISNEVSTVDEISQMSEATANVDVDR